MPDTQPERGHGRTLQELPDPEGATRNQRGEYRDDGVPSELAEGPSPRRPGDRTLPGGAGPDDLSPSIVSPFQRATREIPLPIGWRLGGHGDPIAVFGPEAVVVLMLHADGSVTWRDESHG